jgi:hypothetical protein
MDRLRCHGCKLDLPVGNFWKNARHKRGYQSQCIRCQNAADLARRQRLGMTREQLASAKLEQRLQLGKTCFLCKITKPTAEFPTDASKQFDGLGSACKECKKAITRERYAKRQHVRVKAIAKTKKRIKEHAAGLTDFYIKSLLVKRFTGLRRCDIPAELVDAQRQVLKIKRATKGNP